MRTFVNEQMAAPNVLRVPVDVDELRELEELAASEAGRRRLYWMSPPWNSDVRWYSARSKRDFERFRAVFDRLGIAGCVEEFVDVDREVRLYNGFLVTRSKCTASNFHVDWCGADNEGFTLLTPLSDNGSSFGLLYKKLDGSIADYEYRRGEAIIFGDDFIHSTKPGSSAEPVVLLCFNFGSDKMEHWHKLERTAARQGILVCRPDGQFERVPLLKRARHLVGRFLRWSGIRRPATAQAY